MALIDTNTDKKLRLGLSIGFRGTLLETCLSTSYPTFQTEIPLIHPYVCSSLSLEDKLATLEYCHSTNTHIYCHLSGYYDLARNDNMSKRTVTAVQREVDNLMGIPAAGIIHIGRALHNGTLESISQKLNNLKLDYPRINPDMPYPLLIENAAGQKNEFGWTFDQIRKIYEGLDKKNVGLCIDTQHAYGAGMIDFSNVEHINSFFDEFTPNLFHLNDSKKLWGSRVDRHENIGCGYIFGKDITGLKHLLSICIEKQIDLVLETPYPGQVIDAYNLHNLFK